MTTVDELISTREAAKALNVSHGRARQLVADGVLASIKLGRTRYVKKWSIDRYNLERRPVGRPKGTVVYRLDVLGRRRKVRMFTQRERVERAIAAAG